MTMKYPITYEANPHNLDLQIISDGVAENAKIKNGHKPSSSFAFFIRDANEKIVGGCNGAIFHDWLYVDQLWISESLRFQGDGTQLMLSAEKLAIKNKCHFIAVNTHAFEALDFYKKLGFYVEFERHGFDKDSIFYFLRKDF